MMRTLAACLVLFAVACSAASSLQAQSVAFKIRGEGVGPEGLPLPGQPARPHWVVGNGTHLGKHYGEGSVQTFTAVPDFEAGVISGEFGSGEPFTFVAANGDKLVCYYGRTDKGAEQAGTFDLQIVGLADYGLGLEVAAFWIAEFVVQPDESTGRFAGATGSWIMYASSEPFVLGSEAPVYYGWEGEGRLTFQKGK